MPKGKALSDEEYEKEIQIKVRDIRKAINDANPEMKELLTETEILRRRPRRDNRP